MTETGENPKPAKVRKKATIETGHEVPLKSKVTSMGDLIDLASTIRSLQVGQSFVVDGRKGRVAALQTGLRLCIALTSTIIFNEGETQRFRVWRTE